MSLPPAFMAPSLECWGQLCSTRAQEMNQKWKLVCLTFDKRQWMNGSDEHWGICRFRKERNRKRGRATSSTRHRRWAQCRRTTTVCSSGRTTMSPSRPPSRCSRTRRISWTSPSSVTRILRYRLIRSCENKEHVLFCFFFEERDVELSICR